MPNEACGRTYSPPCTYIEETAGHIKLIFGKWEAFGYGFWGRIH